MSYLQAAIAGVSARAETEAQSIDIALAAGQRSTMQAIIEGSLTPALRDRIGVYRDVLPGARVFNGTSSVAYTTMNEAVVDNFTIGCWVRADATTASTRIVAAWGREGANGYALLQGATGHWGATLPGVSNVGTGISAVTVGEYVFLVLKRTSGVSQFYVNAVAVGSTVASAPNPPNSNAYRSVGAMRNAANTGFTLFFNGAVAWAFFTNHAVSDANLLKMLSGGPGGIGISPDQFDPGSIFNTYPLIGEATEDNTDGAGALTLVSAQATAAGPLVLTSAGEIEFAGIVDQAVRRGLSGTHAPDSEYDIAAGDYYDILGRRVVVADRPEETLKARLTWLVSTYWSTFGVTLDAAQDNGDTLPAKAYDHVNSQDVLMGLIAATGRVPELDDLLVFRMLAPGARLAPFDIEEGDGTGSIIGDVTVTPVEGSYRNFFYVKGGTSRTYEKTDTFTGDGSTTTFSLTYPVAELRGGVTHAGSFETIGVGATWTYNSSTNQITRAAGAPAGAAAISITYDAQGPFWFDAEDAGEVASFGPYEGILELPDEVRKDSLIAEAEAAVARGIAGTKRITYTTPFAGLRPGMQQYMLVPSRGLDDDVVILEVRVSRASGTLLYSVVAVTGSDYSTWQSPIQKWNGGTGTGSGSGAVSFTTPSVGQSSKGNILAQRDTAHEMIMGTVVQVPGTIEGPGFAFPRETGALGGPAQWFLYQAESIYGSGRKELRFFDLQQNGVSTFSACAIRWNPITSHYEFGVQTAVPLQIGDDSTGRRVVVNGSTVRASTGYYERSRPVASGEWADYTPALVAAGGSPTVGTGGTIVGREMRHGTTTWYRVTITLGTSFSFGTGLCGVSLPRAPLSTNPVGKHEAYAIDDPAGTPAVYTLESVLRTIGGNLVPWLAQDTAPLVTITATAPFTFASGDIIRVQGWFEDA